MPFVSGKSQRELMQSLTPYVDTPDSSFADTFAASVGTTIDEDLMISSGLNKEVYQERRYQVAEFIKSDQVDREIYTDRRGRFDYDRLANDRPELNIKTSDILAAERNKILADRRGYAEDVIERGNGMAQFLGAANAFMLDPINIATIGIATAPVAAKSMSVVGRALMTARNEAALNAVVELGIQPLVYEHKSNIDSPYSVQDAIQNIAFAAAGGAVLGGAVGGIGGYIGKVMKSVETLDVITPEVQASYDYLARMQETINAGRSDRETYDSVMSDYDKFQAGEYDSYQAAAQNTVKEAQATIDATVKNENTLGQFFAKSGGIDRSLIETEGIDPASFKDRGKAFGKPLYRKNGGKSPDQLAEALNEIGYKGGRLTANDVVGLIDDIANGIDPLMDLNVQAKIDFHQKIIDDFSQSPDEAYLSELYAGARQSDIESDMEFYKDLEARKVEAGKPSKIPSDYFEPERTKPKKAMGTDREREILNATGMADDFDADMDAYSRIEKPFIIEDGEMVEASKFMKDLDDDIRGIESVLVCARG